MEEHTAEYVVLEFSGGLTLRAEHNGTCYITDKSPDFPDPMGSVTVWGEEDYKTRQEDHSGDEDYAEPIPLEVIEHAELIPASGGRDTEHYWFALREIPKEKLEHAAELAAQAKARADLEYLAMMADVDLEV